MKQLKLKLDKHLYKCPLYWIKYVRSINPTGDEEHLVDQYLLDKYSAVFIMKDGYVKFPNEETRLEFILEWS